VNVIAASGTNLFAGTWDGVFHSSNNGTSWTGVGLTGHIVPSLTLSGTNLFAGTDVGVFLSTDYGTSWVGSGAGVISSRVLCLAMSGTNFIAGTNGAGVFVSADNGSSWTAVDSGLTNADIRAFAVSGTDIFAGTAGGGVFLSTNCGTRWTEVNTGLTNIYILSLAVTGTNLFAGSEGGGVWRRPLSEIVSVGVASSRVSRGFALVQNYPNPFNPCTTIRYALPNASRVTLLVYDLLGRQVSGLVNGKMEAGIHDVTFDGSSLASGMYFYRLQTGDFVATKRLVLQR
jgi:hypothetical protein